MTNIEMIPPFDKETGDLNVIIETPKDSRNKYFYDTEMGLFKLDGILPIGHSFPYDFGFIPSTLGSDGDPLDVLVLMDEPAFTGCLLTARLIGVIEAEQTECDGKTERNDRLIGVSSVSKIYKDVKSLNDLDEVLVDQIEFFFVSYNEAKGKKFKPIGHYAGQKAKSLIDKGAKLYKKGK